MIIYALIARGSLVLAEYSAYKGDFLSTARRLLTQSKITKSKRNFVRDNYVFTYFAEDDFTFMCLNRTDVPKDVTYRFLDQLAELFFSNHGKYDQTSTIKSWGASVSKMIRDLIEDYEEISTDFTIDVEENSACIDENGSSYSNTGSLLNKKNGSKINAKMFKPMSISRGFLQKRSDKHIGNFRLDNHKNGMVIMGILLAAGSLIYLGSNIV